MQIETHHFADELIPSHETIILSIDHSGDTSRLISMGIRPDLTIKLVRKLFFGRTFIFELNNNYRIALRRNEAHTIQVKSVS